MCLECEMKPDLTHEHSASPSHLPDLMHDCDSGGGNAKGIIPSVRYAVSDCCGKYLTGKPDAAICSGCGKQATWKTGPRISSWMCTCGVHRHQELREPKVVVSSD